MSNTYMIIMIAIMVAVTVALRFLPFAVFSGNRKTPPYINYLGKVLPYAIMGMLVVYCMRNTTVLTGSHGLPELISILIVAGLQIWRRNTLISIIAGTVIYMLLVQFVFI